MIGLRHSKGLCRLFHITGTVRVDTDIVAGHVAVVKGC